MSLMADDGETRCVKEGWESNGRHCSRCISSFFFPVLCPQIDIIFSLMHATLRIDATLTNQSFFLHNTFWRHLVGRLLSPFNGVKC